MLNYTSNPISDMVPLGMPIPISGKVYLNSDFGMYIFLLMVRVAN